MKLGHVAIDGPKIKTSASKQNAMSYDHMKTREAELSAEVDRWLAAADAADAEPRYYASINQAAMAALFEQLIVIAPKNWASDNSGGVLCDAARVNGISGQLSL